MLETRCQTWAHHITSARQQIEIHAAVQQEVFISIFFVFLFVTEFCDNIFLRFWQLLYSQLIKQIFVNSILVILSKITENAKIKRIQKFPVLQYFSGSL